MKRQFKVISVVLILMILLFVLMNIGVISNAAFTTPKTDSGTSGNSSLTTGYGKVGTGRRK